MLFIRLYSITCCRYGSSKNDREHLLLTFILKLPFFVIITKTDIAPKNVLENTISDLNKLIKKYKPEHKLQLLEEETQFSDYRRAHLNVKKEVPYIKISNTTGDNIDLLTKYLNSLQIYHDWDSLRHKMNF